MLAWAYRAQSADTARATNLDLGRVPYVLYGVECVGLVSPGVFSGGRSGKRDRRFGTSVRTCFERERRRQRSQ